MADWTFFTNHGRALLLVAAEPDVRLRELATAVGVTERTAYTIVADLAEAGYLVKVRVGRSNRYLVQDHLPVRSLIGKEVTVGELLELLGYSRPRLGQ